MEEMVDAPAMHPKPADKKNGLVNFAATAPK